MRLDGASWQLMVSLRRRRLLSARRLVSGPPPLRRPGHSLGGRRAGTSVQGKGPLSFRGPTALRQGSPDPEGTVGCGEELQAWGQPFLLSQPCCALPTVPPVGGGWHGSTICGKFGGETDRQSTQKHNPDKNEPTFPISVFRGKIFPSALFCLKLRRELMHSSISVRLFGERERDQNKRNNKRPLPASPCLSGARSEGTKARRCVLCRRASDLARQPSSALKGQVSLSSSSDCTRDRAGRWDLPEEGVRGPLFLVGAIVEKFLLLCPVPSEAPQAADQSFLSDKQPSWAWWHG